MATAERFTARQQQELRELPELREKLVDYLQDAHALEHNVLRMLDSMLATTTDPETRERLQRHRMDTERHERMVRERLEAHGAGPSLMTEVPAVVGAWLKGVGDMMRPDKPGKNARDGFVTEHVEIAAYSLLEQLALRAGDLETARVARFILEDEQDMARCIAARWGRFVGLSLRDAGLPAGGGRGGAAGRAAGRGFVGGGVAARLGLFAAVLAVGVGGYLVSQALSRRPARGDGG